MLPHFIFLILLSLFYQSIKCREYIGQSEAFGGAALEMREEISV